MLNEQRRIAADKLIGTANEEIGVDFGFEEHTMFLFDRIIRLSNLANVPKMALVEEMIARTEEFGSYDASIESMLNEYLLTGELDLGKDQQSDLGLNITGDIIPLKKRIRGYVIGVDMTSCVIHIDAQTPEDQIMNYKLSFEPHLGSIFVQVRNGDWIELTIEHTGEDVDSDDCVYGSWLIGKVCGSEDIFCSSGNILSD